MSSVIIIVFRFTDIGSHGVCLYFFFFAPRDHKLVSNIGGREEYDIVVICCNWGTSGIRESKFTIQLVCRQTPGGTAKQKLLHYCQTHDFLRSK